MSQAACTSQSVAPETVLDLVDHRIELLVLLSLALVKQQALLLARLIEPADPDAQQSDPQMPSRQAGAEDLAGYLPDFVRAVDRLTAATFGRNDRLAQISPKCAPVGVPKTVVIRRIPKWHGLLE